MLKKIGKLVQRKVLKNKQARHVFMSPCCFAQNPFRRHPNFADLVTVTVPLSSLEGCIRKWKNTQGMGYKKKTITRDVRETGAHILRNLKDNRETPKTRKNGESSFTASISPTDSRYSERVDQRRLDPVAAALLILSPGATSSSDREP